ncbi:UNVERIFIED_CONTAM: hypothetical protein Sradi_5328100 [Sesamum radiatum]|uniref:Uncharacterized protein n=1 Tax=Sesamum radiatum TaxID=300843 RepID=A0AAW2LSI0_SESRA
MLFVAFCFTRVRDSTLHFCYIMGVEVAESNLNIMAETENEANMSSEGGKVNIKFGSHGPEEPAKGHLNKLSDSSIPKDAVDEWPEPAQVHSFILSDTGLLKTGN